MGVRAGSKTCRLKKKTLNLQGREARKAPGEEEKVWQEEERDYKDRVIEGDDIVNKEKYDYYKGQLYGRLVSLVESGTEAKELLKGFGDRGE